MQEKHTVDRPFTRHVQLDYLLHVPEGKGKHPVIIFLHGRGERGSDLDKIKVHGIPRIVDENPDFPFITVSPQCPGDTSWVMITDALEAMVDDVLKREDVDPSRVYLTGLSMGGYGTWHLAAERPETFAAIAPICGGASWMNGFPERVERLIHTPVWAFHGADDPVVPISEQQQLIDALQPISKAEVRFTVYPVCGHDSWTQTYANPELYDWFVEHRRE